MKKLLKETGVIHETTVSYSPEQNGKAERDMRTIVEASRTMIYAKKLNKYLWGEAVNASVYVLNRTGISRLQEKTPFQVWTGKNFDLKNLQIFGNEVYVHAPKEKRKKWDPKGVRGIFVGYGETSKGYRIYFPEKQTVDIKRDMIFIKPKKENNKEENKQPIGQQEEYLVSNQSETEINAEEYSEENSTVGEEQDPGITETEEREGDSDEEHIAEDEEVDISVRTTWSGRRIKKP